MSQFTQPQQLQHQLQQPSNSTIFVDAPISIPFSKPLSSTFACITSKIEEVLVDDYGFAREDFVVCLNPFRIESTKQIPQKAKDDIRGKTEYMVFYDDSQGEN